MNEINRLILIDDDVNNNYLCRYIIKSVSKDMEILEFTSGAEGLKYLESEFNNERQILLLDLKMPEMDGWEFLEHYAKFDSGMRDKISLYIVSSSIDPSDKSRSEENPNVKGYVTKPLTKGTVQNMLTGLI